MDHFATFGIETGKGRYGEEAVYGVVLLYNLIRNAISSYLQTYGLSPGKFNVLMAIKHQGGKRGVSQVEVSKRLLVTPSNMTRLLDKLEKDGLVVREARSGDRRVNLVKATPKAARLLDEIWPGYVAVVDRLASALGGPDQRAVSALLQKWLMRLEA